MTSKGSKLVALALIAVVVAAGAGYWFFAPKILNEPTSTVQYTSLLKPSERSQTSTESTILASATTVASTTTVWLNVSATQPVSYYLSLLESNGTQPYVQLARELRKIPDLTNATAVAKIAYLALNATNPEVKEAFELMIKGGTPDPRDFTYSVPRYNTELQVLYWLACQNELKKDDTLALSIAMVNGLWVTMGDQEVREAVRNDTDNLLVFLRETSEFQKQRGYHQLEGYPLEAKVALAWTGAGTAGPEGGPFSLSGNAKVPSWNPVDFTKRRLELFHYRWNTVSVETLFSMRTLMQKSSWIRRSVSETVNFMDLYLFGNVWGIPGGHWNYTDSWDERITIDGVEIAPRNFVNVDFEYQYLVEHGYGFGVCADETVLLDAFLRSWGIASTLYGWELTREGELEGHGSVLYYDPTLDAWKGPQVNASKWNYHTAEDNTTFNIVKPPVIQPRCLKWKWIDPLPFVTNARYEEMTTFGKMYGMLVDGIETTQFKQWLLYEQGYTP